MSLIYDLKETNMEENLKTETAQQFIERMKQTQGQTTLFGDNLAQEVVMAYFKTRNFQHLTEKLLELGYSDFKIGMAIMVIKKIDKEMFHEGKK